MSPGTRPSPCPVPSDLASEQPRGNQEILVAGCGTSQAARYACASWMPASRRSRSEDAELLDALDRELMELEGVQLVFALKPRV